MTTYKAICLDCRWEGEFELTGENLSLAVSRAYREHDVAGAERKNRGEVSLHCPADRLEITGPEGIFQVGPGGAPVKIGEAQTKLPPLPDGVPVDWDAFPLMTFLAHAAARYKEDGGHAYVAVEGTEQDCTVTKTSSDSMATSTQCDHYTVTRVEGGWRIHVEGYHSYNDRRGDMYSDYNESSRDIELTHDEAANHEEILRRLRV